VLKAGTCHGSQREGIAIYRCRGRVAQQVVRAASEQNALKPEHVGRLLVVCLLAREALLQPLASACSVFGGRSVVAWRGARELAFTGQCAHAQRRMRVAAQEGRVASKTSEGKGQDAKQPVMVPMARWEGLVSHCYW
jgi:hypothetical protein